MGSGRKMLTSVRPWAKMCSCVKVHLDIVKIVTFRLNTNIHRQTLDEIDLKHDSEHDPESHRYK